MNLIRVVAPQQLSQSTIQLPPSKSACNRALVISALCGFDYQEYLPPYDNLCDDIQAMMDALSAEGDVLDVKAAGTAMRFSTAYFSVTSKTITITGSARLKQRPVAPLVDVLRSLGAKIEYMDSEGHLPLRIQGNPNMQGGEVTLRSDVSSQFVSALLMIAPKMANGLSLHLEGETVSRPYIDMTIGIMKRFGAKVEWTDESTIRVEPQYDLNVFRDNPFRVEADWSAASYWLAIKSLTGNTDIQLAGLDACSLQGDKRCKELFEELESTSQRVNKSTSLEVPPTIVDFSNQPDLVQTFVVYCCMKGLPFHFTGLQTLRVKETDRINALQTELLKLGFIISATDDEMWWNGEMKAEPVDVDSVSISTYDDHRMALSFSLCAIRYGRVIIENPEVVSKSYPTYWSGLEKVGFQIEAPFSASPKGAGL